MLLFKEHIFVVTKNKKIMVKSMQNSQAIITQNPVTIQTNNLANDQNSSGVYINSNKAVELYALPDSFVFQLVNSNENTDVAITAYIFNEDTFVQTTLQNTVGVATKTYADGYSGKDYNRMLSTANNGRGVKFEGFNISFSDANNNPNKAAFAVANLTILAYNGSGSSIPVPITLSRASRNTAQDTGLLTIMQTIWLNGKSQIKVNIPKGNTMDLTMLVAGDQN